MSYAGDRRSHPRDGPDQFSALTAVRVRPGRDARLVDLSRGGLALDAATRLLPGTSVEILLHLNAGVRVVRGAVARCHVLSLHPHHGIRYRAGVRFDTPLGTSDVCRLRGAVDSHAGKGDGQRE